MTLRTFARLLFATVCLCASPTFADNLSGQANIIDGDTLEIHGTRIRLWGIDGPESNQLCRGENIDVGPRPRTTWTRSWLNDRLIACLSALTNTGAQLPSVRLTALTLPTGWYAMASHSIGRNIPRAATMGRNVTLSMAGREYGKAATLSRGCFARAYEAAGGRATVPTMRTRILNPAT